MSDELHGLCWDHPRSSLPLEATSTMFPEVKWSKRSLDSFNEEPLEELLGRFDMVVIDHPFVGRAAQDGLLLPLEELLGQEVLAVAQADAVGVGHDAYRLHGSSWGLDVDSACQVAVRRRDLLGIEDVPQAWNAVLELARRRPEHVGMALAPADAWCVLLSLGSWLGAPVTENSLGEIDEAFEMLRELAAVCHPDSLTLNPPRLLERLSQSDDICYAPLVFGYAIAARHDSRIMFHDAPFADGKGGSLLGGSGIAVPAASSNHKKLTHYLTWLASSETQRRVLATAGGQPPSASVWNDKSIDHTSGRFFSATRKSIEQAFMRPRDAQWPAFQVAAAEVVHRELRSGSRVGASRISQLLEPFRYSEVNT